MFFVLLKAVIILFLLFPPTVINSLIWFFPVVNFLWMIYLFTLTTSQDILPFYNHLILEIGYWSKILESLFPPQRWQFRLTGATTMSAWSKCYLSATRRSIFGFIAIFCHNDLCFILRIRPFISGVIMQSYIIQNC